MEEWKPVFGYEGKYEVSNLGKIKSKILINHYAKIKRDKILKPSFDKDGYLKYGLSVNGNGRIYSAHRVVAQAFIPNPGNKKEVNHKNGIKTDNRVENLEWCTHSENIKHSFTTLLVKNNLFIHNNPSKGKFGKYSSSAKKISCYSKADEHIKDYDSIRDAEIELGICNQNISKCCKGFIKSAGGFIWKYRTIPDGLD